MYAKKVKVVMTEEDINRALIRIAHEIVEANRGAEGLYIIGIMQRGVPLAKRLAGMINNAAKAQVPVGALDVSLYRDDLKQKGQYVKVRKSDLPVSLDGKTVILVDDVIYAGRTGRAALDGLKDYGRAAKIQLAALVDRGHRELPIQPDYVGKRIPTSAKEKVRVEVLEVDGVDRAVIE